MSDSNRNRCPIPGCERWRNAGQVMCQRHWFQVPRELRQNVWDWLRRAKGSIGHVQAVRAAIDSVVQQQAEKNHGDETQAETRA